MKEVLLTHITFSLDHLPAKVPKPKPNSKNPNSIREHKNNKSVSSVTSKIVELL